MKTLLNPYAYRLNGNRDTPRSIRDSVPPEPVAKHRGCEIYKVARDHFAFACDGVIFAERSTPDATVADLFLDGSSDEVDGYFAGRMQSAHALGLQAAGEAR